MTGRLLHYSGQPLECVVDVDDAAIEQLQPELSPYAKPFGLWVSVEGDDDWLSWCRSAEFRSPEYFAHATEVHLAKDANVLQLATVEALQAFNKEYGVGWQRRAERPRLGSIDWPRVMAAHDGLIIAPYQWRLRLELDWMWYYTWDCASGCIWRARAVDWLEAVEPPVVDWDDARLANLRIGNSA